MFGSWILDVGIGLIVVFILFSTVCSTVREGIDGWLKTRAAFLERGIREMLGDRNGEKLCKDVYEHPLVFGLFCGDYSAKKQKDDPGMFDRGGKLPSYIPSKNFALALMDVVARGPVADAKQNGAAPALKQDSPLTLDGLRASAAASPNKQVGRVVLSAIDTAHGDLEQVRRNLEQWFDSSMDRVSGWYRRKTNVMVFWIGLVLAAVFNIDAFAIANHLYRNNTARNDIVEQAQKMLDAQARKAAPKPATPAAPAAPAKPFEPGAGSDAAPIQTTSVTPGGATAATDATDKSKAASDNALFNGSLGLPIGWTTFADYNGTPATGSLRLKNIWRTWSSMVAGWVIIALAATLGAPFWFDVLDKFMIVRSTVKSYEKSQEKGSKERPSAPVPASEQPFTSTVYANGGKPVFENDRRKSH